MADDASQGTREWTRGLLRDGDVGNAFEEGQAHGAHHGAEGEQEGELPGSRFAGQARGSNQKTDEAAGVLNSGVTREIFARRLGGRER